MPDGGLIVPVIRGAEERSLIGLARQVNDLAERARTGKLSPDEVQGGTFTLTNHGTKGSLFATPVINQPQSGILGTGMIQKRGRGDRRCDCHPPDGLPERHLRTIASWMVPRRIPSWAAVVDALENWPLT